MSVSRRQGNPAVWSEICTRPGAIDPERGFPAPQIGDADETLGDAHEIAGALTDADKMIGEDEAATRQLKKWPVYLPDRRNGGAKAKLGDGRTLDVRLGVEICQPRADAMGIFLHHGGKAIYRGVADIAVLAEAAPTSSHRENRKRSRVRRTAPLSPPRRRTSARHGSGPTSAHTCRVSPSE